jgi:hypothetical protein
MVRVPLGNRANPIAKKSADEPHFFRIFRGTTERELEDRQSVSKRVRGVITMSFFYKSELALSLCQRVVGAIGLEPTTPTMSRWCSNQLSYAPEFVFEPSIVAEHVAPTLVTA